MSITKFYKNRKNEVITIELDDDMTDEEMSDLIEYAIELVNDDLDTFVDDEIGEFEAEMIISEHNLRRGSTIYISDENGTAEVIVFR